MGAAYAAHTARARRLFGADLKVPLRQREKENLEERDRAKYVSALIFSDFPEYSPQKTLNLKRARETQ